MISTITERYGSHILTITYFKNSAKVTVEDLAEIKFPLIYSGIMSKENANAYLKIFIEYGYIKICDVDSFVESYALKKGKVNSYYGMTAQLFDLF